ncbi:protease inhibitor I42 family protein [Kitasatospora sp. NPDC004240]
MSSTPTTAVRTIPPAVRTATRATRIPALAARTPALAAAVVLLLAGTAACGSGDDPAGTGRGRVLDAQERIVDLKAGERFTVAVRDNASIGDRWRFEDPRPDPAVLTTVGDRYEAAPGAEKRDGAGGTRYFTFEGRAAGTTTITLFNCFRGLCSSASPSDHDRKLLVRNTYTVTVR